MRQFGLDVPKSASTLRLYSLASLPVKVRFYKPTDLPALIATFTASVHGLAAPFYTPEQITAWAPVAPDSEFWTNRMASLPTLVIESNGVIVGFAVYDPGGYVDFLYVHPAFVRRGIATLLYRHMESVLRAAAIARISTHASLAARAFFERQGFKVDAEESVECRGATLQRFAMHKDLA